MPHLKRKARAAKEMWRQQLERLKRPRKTSDVEPLTVQTTAELSGHAKFISAMSLTIKKETQKLSVELPDSASNDCADGAEQFFEELEADLNGKNPVGQNFARGSVSYFKLSAVYY